MRTILLSIPLLVMLMALSGFYYTAPAQAPEFTAPCDAQSLDLSDCESNCRSNYGGEPFYRRGGGHIGFQRMIIFNRCMQRCQKAYWREFDEQIEDLKNE